MNKRFFAEFLALLSLKVTYYAKDDYNDDDDDVTQGQPRPGRQ